MVPLNNTTAATNGTEGSSGFNNKSVTNGQDDHGIEQFEESTGLYAFRLVLFSLIILASLIGNSVVCKAVWSIPFHKPFSYQLVANMAFAEIINSLCLPFMLADRETEDSVIHGIKCVLNPLQVLCLMVETHSMAAIAFYRYRVLVNPIPRGPSRNVKVATICSLWLVPAVICIPTFTGFKIEDGTCVLQPVMYNKLHVYIRFVLNFVVPYFVMLTSYGAVAWNLRKRIEQKVAQARESIIPSSTAVEEVELQDLAESEDKEEDLTEDRKRKVLVDLNNRRCSKPEKTDLEEDLLKMIYAIILIFVVCYFPYQALYLWEYIAEIDSWQFRYHYSLQNYLFILTCLPNALHPVCYGTMNSFYAMAFSKIFLCKKS